MRRSPALSAAGMAAFVDDVGVSAAGFPAGSSGGPSSLDRGVDGAGDVCPLTRAA